MDKHRSGHPRAQQERRQAYRKSSGPVSNPGQPSTTNRKARRATWDSLTPTQAERDLLAEQGTDHPHYTKETTK